MTQDCIQYSNDQVARILQTIEELNRLKDVDTILDKILYEARQLAHADAGSIFLVQEDQLRFSYVQNDTLFNKDETNVALYTDLSEPISHKSIVGYVAATGQTVAISDAYHIPDGRPYSFNPAYDQKSGYQTVSMLTLPLGSPLVGVMQLINAKDENNRVIAFPQDVQVYMPLFANHASIAIERGILNREMILRMMKMAELRDPHETGAHVQRVGAYSAEIYQSYARKRGLDLREIKRTRDIVRLASMLHDVGKVGISDTILKKPAKLTDEEYGIMKWHTVYGARLFTNNTSSLDEMSYDIALNHHEKWSGGGYPGRIPDVDHPDPAMGRPKTGEEIPLAARIAAIADVFDALSSRRSYKEPWTDDKICDVIEEESGRHFDPEIVTIFFEIFDVIKAIREKYRE